MVSPILLYHQAICSVRSLPICSATYGKASPQARPRLPDAEPLQSGENLASHKVQEAWKPPQTTQRPPLRALTPPFSTAPAAVEALRNSQGQAFASPTAPQQGIRPVPLRRTPPMPGQSAQSGAGMRPGGPLRGALAERSPLSGAEGPLHNQW